MNKSDDEDKTGQNRMTGFSYKTGISKKAEDPNGLSLRNRLSDSKINKESLRTLDEPLTHKKGLNSHSRFSPFQANQARSQTKSTSSGKQATKWHKRNHREHQPQGRSCRERRREKREAAPKLGQQLWRKRIEQQPPKETINRSQQSQSTKKIFCNQQEKYQDTEKQTEENEHRKNWTTKSDEQRKKQTTKLCQKEVIKLGSPRKRTTKTVYHLGIGRPISKINRESLRTLDEPLTHKKGLNSHSWFSPSQANQGRS
ncbi:hypothetical protein M9H77_22692 [Catharanthus roseus]|uniref:Uncharacterized protein n=1 Tax=Catharanthus roseus TaxID=4058 RepID=A0ACC0AR63_CATRO|nr:hypothetical protein M9H77_22692 [Catharanthus roseus]